MADGVGRKIVSELVATLASPVGSSADEQKLLSRTAALSEALAANRDRSLTAIRELLDGPPLPVRLAAGGARQHVGAKLVAIQVLVMHYAEEDVERLWSLASATEEPLPVRLAAASGWSRLCDCEAVPDLVNLLVESFEVTEETAPDLLAPFADSRDLLVRPLLGHLYHRDRRFRARAAELLAALGEPALPALREVVDTTEDNFAREQALQALEKIVTSATANGEQH